MSENVRERSWTFSDETQQNWALESSARRSVGGTKVAVCVGTMTLSNNHGTMNSRFTLALAFAPVLLAGCSSRFDGGELLGEVQQASTCTGNTITFVDDYWGEQGVPRSAVQKNYRAVGRLVRNNCPGAYLGNGYYLGSGGCSYVVNDVIMIEGAQYTVQSIVKQKSDSSFKYALVKLQGATDADLNHGIFRLAKRAPVAGEVIGALMAVPTPDGFNSDHYFVGGTVTDLNLTNRFRHRLDTPVPYGRGAPIVDKNGYLLGIQTEDTCTGNTGQNGAMRIDQILADLPAVDRDALTQKMPCSGSTPIGNTAWVGAGVTDVIRVNIDTSFCGFTSTPLYFTSLGGGYDHNEAQSATAIYDRTNAGFRVNVQRPGLTPQYANDAGWYINWTAFPPNYNDDIHQYRCAGSTGTTWSAFDSTTIYQDVTIPAWCTTVAPRYFFTSLVGNSEHRTASGVNTIYQKTDNSFRVYLYRAAGITPALANTWGWALNWQASDKNGSGRLESLGNASGTWYDYFGSIGIDLYNPIEWGFEPRYFASLVISNNSQRPPMTGVSAINWPYEFGFSTLLQRPGSTVQDANASWEVQWVARP